MKPPVSGASAEYQIPDVTQVGFTGNRGVRLAKSSSREAKKYNFKEYPR
jgi:hypothetical protein